MATTPHQATRAALQSALKGRAGLTGIEIAQYPQDPAEAITRRDLVWLGTESGTQEHERMGAVRVHESWTLEVGVWCQREGNGASKALDAHTQAVTLFAELENEIRDDPTIGGNVRYARVASWETRHEATDQSRVCVINAIIEAEAGI